MDKCGVLKVGVKSSVSKTLFPNIASCPALPTVWLLEQHVSQKSMEHGDYSPFHMSFLVEDIIGW